MHDLHAFVSCKYVFMHMCLYACVSEYIYACVCVCMCVNTCTGLDTQRPFSGFSYCDRGQWRPSARNRHARARRPGCTGAGGTA